MTISPRFLPAINPRGRRAETRCMRRKLAAWTAALACLASSGCLMPNAGTPVWVDSRAGEFWSGAGLLLEVSEDRLRCRVAVRDRALFVHERWVACASVHTRRGR